MTETDLAAAVRAAVDQWMQGTLVTDQKEALLTPAVLGVTLGLIAEGILTNQGHAQGAARAHILNMPHCHLKGAFDATCQINTPDDFVPVPDTKATIAGRAAAIAVHGLSQLETVSYGSENNGNLFVNLVPMSGSGAFAEKSKSSMRGHTDAVSFPFNREDDPQDQRIAPSPDCVTLVGLSNPNNVPTTFIPIDDVLRDLSQTDVDELKKSQFLIRAQKTFREGTKRILGREHTVDGAPVLKSLNGKIYVRYSHSNVLPEVEGSLADQALKNLEVACSHSAKSVVIRPGDILIVSNRLALHGRGAVGDRVGSNSRWLLRTYGLDTSHLQPCKRSSSLGSSHVLFP